MLKNTIIFLLLLFSSTLAEAKKERILFDLKFAFAKGGEAELIITDTVYMGKPAIHYYMAGRTTGLSDKLFAVNDVYETFVDAKTRLPIKCIRNIKEQKYRYYNETFFYPDKDSIYSKRTGWMAVPPNLVDLLSSFFYYIHFHLTDNISSAKTITIPTYHAGKVSNVSIRYMGQEKIDTELGKVDTYILAPVVDKGKLLNRSDGLQFYISKQKRVPIQLIFDMRVGSLKAVLRSYKINGIEQVTK